MQIGTKLTRDGEQHDVVVFFSAEQDKYGEASVCYDFAEFEDTPEDGNTDFTAEENAALECWLETVGFQDAIDIAATNLLEWKS
jgi:hypothetical protein